MPGPAPTPSAILQARGSWRGQRKEEPELPVKAPGAPSWLSAEAKAEWRRQAKHLEVMGTIAEADRAMLALYCQAWAEFVETNKTIEEEGMTCTTDKGYVLPNPLVAIRNAAAERLVKLAAQFGFSPAARTRVRGGKKKKDEAKDGKGRFFQAG